MSNIIVLVGPCGAGKSKLAYDLIHNDGDHGLATVYVNQDSQNKNHLKIFADAILNQKDIIVDRLNFNKDQRRRYLEPAKAARYNTKIIVLHQNRVTCLERMRNRLDHPTIKDEESANSALNMFFQKYERPTEDEADEIQFVYPELFNPPKCIWVDIDGTAANTDHRQRFMDLPKKDWKGFFGEMHLDSAHVWCRDIVNTMRQNHIIVFASGRPDNYKEVTKTWLEDNKFQYDHLFMRPRQDSRKDDIVKEIILDYEVKTRYDLSFCIDDRKQVVDKLRSRGITVLQCAEGNF